MTSGFLPFLLITFHFLPQPSSTPTGGDVRPRDGAAPAARLLRRNLASIPPMGRRFQIRIASSRAKARQNRRWSLGFHLLQSARLRLQATSMPNRQQRVLASLRQLVRLVRLSREIRLLLVSAGAAAAEIPDGCCAGRLQHPAQDRQGTVIRDT